MNLFKIILAKKIFFVIPLVILFNQKNFSQSINEKRTDSLAKAEKIPLSLVSVPYSTKDINPLEKKINPAVLSSLGLLYLGTGIGIHIYQANAWWKDQRSEFHFVNDWKYALWQDKIGHIYGGVLLAHFFSAGLEAGNISTEESFLYGSLAAFAFQLYVEVEDGFGPNWGFSPGDLAANSIGAGFSLAQYYFPYLKNFQIKLSYYPSKKYRDGSHKGNIIDDYEGQKYWLSFRMKNLLPDVISEYWPSFLNLALGTGVQNLDGVGGGGREIFIAFDIDAEQIPLYGSGWQFVKNTLNYIHFPMPGFRITQNGAFFLLAY